MAKRKEPCSVADCNNDARSRGYCPKHYKRWRRLGDATAPRPKAKRRWPEFCTVPGCERPHLSRGYCSTHYNERRATFLNATCAVDGCRSRATHRGLCDGHGRRARRYGDPLASRKPANGACEGWLREHLTFSGDECLIWPFARTEQGYAKYVRNRRKVYGSREMCRLAHGEPLTPKHEAAHSCGAGHLGCVNPRHLRWATAIENQADRLEHGTDTRGEKNAGAKLSEEAVRHIRGMRGVMLQRELAELYGVDKSTIGKVQRREWWAWLD